MGRIPAFEGIASGLRQMDRAYLNPTTLRAEVECWAPLYQSIVARRRPTQASLTRHCGGCSGAAQAGKPVSTLVITSIQCIDWTDALPPSIVGSCISRSRPATSTQSLRSANASARIYATATTRTSKRAARMDVMSTADLRADFKVSVSGTEEPGRRLRPPKCYQGLDLRLCRV